jgi:hypothetical protein
MIWTLVSHFVALALGAVGYHFTVGLSAASLKADIAAIKVKLGL